MGRLELYVYTMPSYRKKGWVKVGHSQIGGSEFRIKRQIGTSNPEYPEWVVVGKLPVNKRDHHVHALLQKHGFKKVEDSPGKEWFCATFDDVKKAFNDLVYGCERRDNYKLRDEQKQAVEKGRRWFLKDYPVEVIRGATHPKRFLINAKMRFGKCFTSIHLAKSMDAKRVLIVTYKPDVIGEWIDVVNNHVDFDGWEGIRAKSKEKASAEPTLEDHDDIKNCETPIVLCVSLQDLAIDEKGNTKERLQTIPQINWDLIIFDEVHYGSRTERAHFILEQLQFQYRLDLSGTPFKLIEYDDFCAQQVFTYSYLDEQKNKRDEVLKNPPEKIYRLMPDLKISTIEITEKDINEQRELFETDNIDFSLNKLFQVREGKFLYEDAVSHFIDGLTRDDHQARSISVFGKLGQHLQCPPRRHAVWWLSRVESAKVLIKKLQAHPYFSKFAIINASGSDTKKEEDDALIAREKSKVEDAIKKVESDPSKLGTITLTCGRFLTGVTIKEWDSILILNDTSSAESYFQAIFRVQSRWVHEESGQNLKPVAWVFDFAITRCLELTYAAANNIADQLDQHASYEGQGSIQENNLDIVTEDLCKTLDIQRFYEGSLVSIPTTAEDIFKVLNHEGSKIALAKRITSDLLVNFANLKFIDERLRDILAKIKGYRTQNVSGFDMNKLVQIGRDAEKLKDIRSDPNLAIEEKEKHLENFYEKDKDKERKTYKQWYATQIKRLAICMADFIYMTYEREMRIEDVIETKSSHFFEIMTGISKSDFSELCKKGFIQKSPLNRIVREFRDQETTSLNPEEYIFKNISIWKSMH
ncbi:DEAD/DEAH box helicase family protein [Legionella nagasakiensis]|uniref:DEAD/DEAH box helicase family protein n=1 Tax=Legionella nagasakiensis TaxID=535290 RepID=UPI0010552366|nr:DEAD/DEAH box helicase family protein [Legionella nagasakiensis]